MRLIGATLVSFTLSVGPLCGQSDSEKIPPPEAKRLDFFVGKWEVNLQLANGSKESVTQNCERFGTLHIVCRIKIGNVEGMRIDGYDPGSTSFYDFLATKDGEMSALKIAVTEKTWRIVEINNRTDRRGQAHAINDNGDVSAFLRAQGGARAGRQMVNSPHLHDDEDSVVITKKSS